MRKCLICRAKSASNISLFHFPKDQNDRQKWVEFVGPERKITSTSCICCQHFSSDSFIVSGPEYRKKLLKKGAVPTIFARGKEICQAENDRMKVFDGTNVGGNQSNQKKNLDDIANIEISEGCNFDRNPTNAEIDVDQSCSYYDSMLQFSSTHSLVDRTNSENAPPSQDCNLITIIPLKRNRGFPRYFGDFQTPDMQSPRRAKRLLELVRKVIPKYKQEISNYKRQNAQLQKKLENAEKQIVKLQQEKRIAPTRVLSVRRILPRIADDSLASINKKGSGKITLKYKSSCQPTDFELVRAEGTKRHGKILNCKGFMKGLAEKFELPNFELVRFYCILFC